LAGRDPPFGFTRIGAGSDAFMVTEGDYALQAAIGTVDPQWFWAFLLVPRARVTSVIALNPPLHLAFSVQPSRTLTADGHSARGPGYGTERRRQPGHQLQRAGDHRIGRNGSINPLMPGTLSGTTTVSAVNGVATFSNLSIDQLGNGYTWSSAHRVYLARRVVPSTSGRCDDYANGFVAAAFLLAACSESTGPQRHGPRPAFATAASPGIVLDKYTGVQGETGSEIGQGFNPRIRMW